MNTRTKVIYIIYKIAGLALLSLTALINLGVISLPEEALKWTSAQVALWLGGILCVAASDILFALNDKE